MKRFAVVAVLAVLLIAGCISPEDVAKGTEMTQDFFNKYHNAALTVTHLDQNQMEVLLPSLNELCGNYMTLDKYNKVSIADSAANAELVIWIDASNEPVCAIRTEPELTIVQPSPRYEKSPYESGMPDLIVSKVDISPDSPSMDDMLSITITIENIGRATAYPVEYIVAAYGDQGKLLRSNTDNQRVSLEPRGTVTYVVVVNAAEIPSDHLLRVGVNPSYAGHFTVEESNYDNNIKDTPITII